MQPWTVFPRHAFSISGLEVVIMHQVHENSLEEHVGFTGRENHATRICIVGWDELSSSTCPCIVVAIRKDGIGARKWLMDGIEI